MSWQSTPTLQAGSSYGSGNQGFDNAWNAYLGTSSGYSSSSANVSCNATRCKDGLEGKNGLIHFNFLVEVCSNF